MKKTLVTPTLLAAIALLGGMNAQAQTIISDTYTATNGTAVSTHTPNTDVPAGAYRTSSSGSDSTVPTIEGDTLQYKGSGTAAISLASNGTYIEPTTFTISGALEVDTITNDASAAIRGIGLGFYASSGPDDAPSGVFNRDGFTGIEMSTNGTLYLLTPSLYTTTTSPTIAYNSTDLGTFSAAAFYTLSYTVNTATGSISDITLSDSQGTETGTFTTTAFTETQTAYASSYAATSGALTSLGAAQTSAVDDFSVTGPLDVPEPSTYVMILGGIAFLFVSRRLRITLSSKGLLKKGQGRELAE